MAKFTVAAADSASKHCANMSAHGTKPANKAIGFDDRNCPKTE
jgi:hypothetical protein